MTISEVGKKYGLTHNTLRYYERIGLLPYVNRTSGGIRNYTEEDCKWIEFIKCMKGAGLSIEALVEYVSYFQNNKDKTGEARKQILIEQYDQLCERLDEMAAVKKKLEGKIEHYSNIIESEKKLKS